MGRRAGNPWLARRNKYFLEASALIGAVLLHKAACVLDFLMHWIIVRFPLLHLGS